MKTRTESSLSVLLLAEQGYHTLPVVTCLGQVPGVRLHVVSDLKASPTRLSRFVATFHTYGDGGNETLKWDRVASVARAVRADVLLPVTENGVRLLARHAEAFRGMGVPPLPTPELLATVSDKFQLAQILSRHGLPSPATELFSSLDTLEEQIARLTFPVLFKPVAGGGGCHIQKFDTPAALREFLGGQAPAAGSCVLQSYISGTDVDCSILCRDGRILAHTIQTPLHARKNPFATDRAIRFGPHALALATVTAAVAALGWNGIAHLDMREDERDGRIHIVDFNPRYWTTLLGSLAVGVNFPHLACLAATGTEFSPPHFEADEYLMADVAFKKLMTGQLNGSKTGLPYLLSDPVPRAWNFVRRKLSLFSSTPPVLSMLGELQPVLAA